MRQPLLGKKIVSWHFLQCYNRSRIWSYSERGDCAERLVILDWFFLLSTGNLSAALPLISGTYPCKWVRISELKGYWICNILYGRGWRLDVTAFFSVFFSYVQLYFFLLLFQEVSAETLLEVTGLSPVLLSHALKPLTKENGILTQRQSK